MGDYKLLAECYSATEGALTGRVALFDLGADPSESHDLATTSPGVVVSGLLTCSHALSFCAAPHIV